MAIATVLATTTGASAQRLIFGTLDRITCERTNRPNWIHSIEQAAIPVEYHRFGSWYGNSVRRALATHLSARLRYTRRVEFSNRLSVFPKPRTLVSCPYGSQLREQLPFGLGRHIVARASNVSLPTNPREGPLESSKENEESQRCALWWFRRRRIRLQVLLQSSHWKVSL